RERLFGTGSSTNAYTDFHHTVFYASCPVLTPPGWGRPTPMLGRALGALLDVLEAVCEESRLEKERSAVLSELTMVNTIDYRMECQVLSALHAENQLSRRFPIGKEELIKGWNTKDVLEFHRKHYRPDNAVLYCIGDLNVDETEDQIRQMFGHLGGVPDTTAFSLHVFAKRPIEPITSLGDFRRAIMKRIALAALQIRLSVNSRKDPPFLSVEFNQLDSPREGCAVCFLDMTAEPAKWKDAVKFAVREVRRLGMFGLTSGELKRFSSALLTDARQLAAQGNRISNRAERGGGRAVRAHHPLRSAPGQQAQRRGCLRAHGDEGTRDWTEWRGFDGGHGALGGGRSGRLFRGGKRRGMLTHILHLYHVV
ncbi:unnamed protein product, partial [Ectocarpus fasciculatus]